MIDFIYLLILCTLPIYKYNDIYKIYLNFWNQENSNNLINYSRIKITMIIFVRNNYTLRYAGGLSILEINQANARLMSTTSDRIDRMYRHVELTIKSYIFCLCSRSVEWEHCKFLCSGKVFTYLVLFAMTLIKKTIKYELSCLYYYSEGNFTPFLHGRD